jgi:hypothetical protein
MLKKFIIGTQVFFLIWVISGIAGANCEAEEYVGACEAGTGIGIFLLIMLWAFVNFILLVIWLVTRKKQELGE